MQPNLVTALTNTFALFVSTEPMENQRSFQETDEQGRAVGDAVNWDEQVLRGVFMTNAFAKDKNTELEIQIRPSQIKSIAPEAARFGNLLKDYLRNENDLRTGKKHIIAKTVNMPREVRSGDKNGLSTTLTPILLSYEIVESSPKDVEFIESVLSARNTQGQVATEQSQIA